MKQSWKAGMAGLALMSAAVLGVSAAADPGVTLIGTGFIPGLQSDLSGLEGQNICTKDAPSVCIDQARLGGLGSAVTYTGFDSVFLATPDRGPFDGRTNVPFLDRFHFLHLAVDTTRTFQNITATLLDTRFMSREANTPLVGSAYAFSDTNPRKTDRFDPEGVVVSNDGNFFVSDEYGPYILEFNRQGKLQRRIAVPAKFFIAHQSGDLNGSDSKELLLNCDPTNLLPVPCFGRQANRGMEGLAITPDGRMLVGIMQNALLQDNGWTAADGRVGFNNRILTVDLETGITHEYVYVMDAVNQGRGVNDLLAINDHEFLVLERDNRVGSAANLKRIYRIDLTGATDVSSVAGLPRAALPSTGTPKPVLKRLFLDLLNPFYTIGNGQTIKSIVAEKIEGLAWGPELTDGRRLLYVLSDNDLTDQATQIFAFAVDPSAAGLDLEMQQVSGPLFPPGQVKKALRR